MTTLLFLAVFAGSSSGTTLGDIISIERLEHGDDGERLGELDSAFDGLNYYHFTPTPDEFRIVAEGLRHKNDKIRAVSAAMLEKLSSQSAKNVAAQLTCKRERYGSLIDDETWFRSAYYLVHCSEIPAVDAYQAFQIHFKYRRCGADRYLKVRGNFDFSAHLQTRDLPTLNYALRYQINLLENPTRQVFDDAIMKRVANIAEHCPNQETRDLAKKLYDLIGRQDDDR